MTVSRFQGAVNLAQPGSAPEMSRRAAIVAGGLVAAGAAGLAQAASASAAASASSSSPIGIVFGADYSGFLGFHSATSLAVGFRWYYHGENEFPPTWPIRPFKSIKKHMTLSLRPNPSELLAGKLDHKLKAIIDSAPEYSELTFWHENTSFNPLGYPGYVNNPSTAKKIQRYGHDLCKGTKVLFGVITVGEVREQVHWIAPGLDWYGDDFYEFPKLRGPNNTFDKAKVLARLNQNLHYWQKVTGLSRPNLRITEVNTPYNSHRREFYTTVADWLARHNGNRMLTFWKPGAGLAQGGLSGPWPPSPSVRKTLASLAREYDWRTLPT